MVTAVKVADQLVVLKFRNGKSLEYPVIWLRDNCQCEECFHQPTHTRTLDWDCFNFDVQLEDFDVKTFLMSVDRFIDFLCLLIASRKNSECQVE